MPLQLFKTPTGEVALVANRHLIIDGETDDDSAKLVEQTSERLSVALEAPLEIVAIEPASVEWNWEGLIAQVALAATTCRPPAAATCAKCGTQLKGGMCGDETCPYSDWPQQVSVSDMEGMSADEIVAKYGLIRAEAHSDDRVFEGAFFAEGWFIGATEEQIKNLVREEWGRCEEADDVARSAEKTPKVCRMFEYVHARSAGGGEQIGFECTINPKDAMAWLRRQRYGLWAQIVCEEHGVRIVEAQEPEVEGYYDWLDDHGNACDTSFICADEAAMDAVKRLGLDPHAPVTPLFYAFWDISAFYSPTGKDTRLILGPAQFSDDLGYGEDDIADIAALAVGETWESPDYGPQHTVRRIR